MTRYCFCQKLVSNMECHQHIVQQRSVIRFLVLEGVKGSEICRRLKTVYGEHVLSDSTIYEWIAKFKRGESSVNDAPRAGRPISATTETTTLTCFWDHKGPLLVEFLEPGTTINAERYCKTLQKLKRALKDKRPELRDQDVQLLQDNARPHTALRTQQLLARFQWTVINHPPYSPDLAPSDYHIFGPMKNHLRGIHFREENELKNSATKWIRTQSTEFYNRGIRLLPVRWRKCIDSNGDYIEQ